MARRGRVNRRRHPLDTLERPVRFRKYQQLCLIVCEDQKTEPTYFRAFAEHFPENTFFLKCVGTGRDSLGVVAQSLIEKELIEKEAKKEVDFTWVVFYKDDADVNDTRIERFKKAFEVAEHNAIRLAYRNEVFELWLLLHLRGVEPSQPIPRHELYTLLEQAVKEVNEANAGYVYEHGNVDILKQIDEWGDEQLAIERAKILEEYFKDEVPLYANPSTKVHLLVSFLRDWIAYHNWTEH